MKFLITGGTGFVGTALTRRLVQAGHEVTVLSRSPKESSRGVTFLQGDPTRKGPWQEAIREHDAVFNLAGASIFAKWTEEHKKAIRESRISATRNVVDGIPLHPPKSFTLFSASAVGYYGFCGDEELTEDSPPGNDFLARIAREWESEALRAKEKGARVVITRLGIVLGEKGGVLSQMLPLFQKYIGGPIGHGKQWFSWIHIKDLMEAFLFLTRNQEISGPVNLCSPHPVRNRDLARALGKVLHRPSFVPAPGFMIKLFLGEFGSVILEGQRVIPKKLLASGFQFQFPEIEMALEEIIRAA